MLNVITPKTKTSQVAKATSSLAFVLVNYNGLEDTLECLESIQANNQQADVILVDNASDSFDEASVNSRFPDTVIIRNAENLGWSGGNNTGIRKALQSSADWICLLNNDTKIAQTFIETHLQTIEKNPQLRIYGPLINEFSEPEQQQTAACFFNQKSHMGFMEGRSISPNQETIELHDTDIVNGCCVLIHREVFEQIGIIDDAFFLVCEESDFCLRAKEAGFAPKVLARTLLWHKHSVSFARAGKPLQRYYAIRNLWLLIKKHPKMNEGKRGWIATRWMYFRHAYHLFCHEQELKNPLGSLAICDGITDAMMRRWGRRQDVTRRLPSIIYRVFQFAQSVRRKASKCQS